MSKKEELIRILILFVGVYFLMTAVDVFYYQKYVENYSVLNATYEQIKEREKADVIKFLLNFSGFIVLIWVCLGSKLAKLSKKKSDKKQ